MEVDSEASTAATAPSPIVFAPVKVPEPVQGDKVQLAKEKHQARAARFGTEYTEPNDTVYKSLMERKRRPNPRGGFAVGFDIDGEEGRRRREERAARFAPGADAAAAPSAAAAGTSEAAGGRESRDEAAAAAAAVDDVMELETIEPRREVAAEVERRPEALYVHGTDLMSTDDVFSYFGSYGPAFVEWINDSSCNVAFLDPPAALRALKGMAADAAAVANLSEQQLLTEWVRARPWTYRNKSKRSFPITLRFSTVQDVLTGQHHPVWLWARGAKRAVPGRGAVQRGRGGSRGASSSSCRTTATAATAGAGGAAASGRVVSLEGRGRGSGVRVQTPPSLRGRLSRPGRASRSDESLLPTSAAAGRKRNEPEATATAAGEDSRQRKRPVFNALFRSALKGTGTTLDQPDEPPKKLGAPAASASATAAETATAADTSMSDVASASALPTPAADGAAQNDDDDEDELGDDEYDLPAV